jgi:hypothetical protein
VNHEQANQRIALLADEETIFFLDINRQLLEADGTLSIDVMPDRLHPNPKGYQIWAESIDGGRADGRGSKEVNGTNLGSVGGLYRLPAS